MTRFVGRQERAGTWLACWSRFRVLVGTIICRLTWWFYLDGREGWVYWVVCLFVCLLGCVGEVIIVDRGRMT